MRRRAPLLVVTLPARSFTEAQTQIRVARAGGADIAEVRLDRLPPDELVGSSRLFPSPIPLLATYRSRGEGGMGRDEPEARRRILEDAARLPFAWIDLEADRDRTLITGLPSSSGREFILSTHLPSDVSLDELNRRFREPVPPRTIRKIVLECSVSRWLKDVVPSLPPPGEVPLLVSATGPAGPLSRAWAKRLGLPAIFASLPREAVGAGLVAAVEPSQVPVDRLRRYLDADGEPPLFAIVGHPVSHSLSPDLHSRWMQDDGRPGLYVPIDIGSDEELIRTLPVLAQQGFRGVNVTHPFKAIALGAASRVERAAEICGAANCLTFEGEELEAQNTDLAAILRRLGELRERGQWDGRSLSVIGAGGAARATLAAARELGAHARLYARRPEAAAEVARSFGAAVGDASADGPSSLLVHATPLGRDASEPLTVPLARLVGPGTHVVDWVYAPEHGIVRSTIEARGGTYEDGWRLLVYQAAASYAIWWGEPPDDRAVTAAAQGEL